MTAARTTIIAEAGVNHNGSLDLALQLVDAAKHCGADVVKFQTFDAAKLASRVAPKARYQTATTDAAESQLEMLRALELAPDALRKIVEHCGRRGIRFLSSPFDEASLALLIDRFGMTEIKLGSGELTNAPLLLAAARTGRSVLLSTGMGSLAEIEAALGVLAFGYLSPLDEKPCRAAFARWYCAPEARARLAENVKLLHCTTEYPAPIAEANLRAMDTIRAAFGIPVGYSDHTSGIAVAIAAAARGAVIVEKHLTLDRRLEGPDHAASLEPEVFAAMVSAIRDVDAALGDGTKRAMPSETANIAVARKSLVAARDIGKGEVLCEQDLAVKRPGSGISPFDLWDWIGRASPRAFMSDELIRS